MSKAAIAVLEEGLKKEHDALNRDRASVERLRNDIVAHEQSVKTRTTSIAQLKAGIEILRL